MDAQNFLMGGGIKAARMTLGQPVRLTITDEPKVQQQTDPNDQSPKYFKNGDPMMQLVITGATDQRDPQNPEDDGKRRFYIKGKQMTAVVRDAVKISGAKGVEVGGVLTLTWVSGGPRFEGESPLSWGKDNPKVYTASYEKPTNTAASNFLAAGGEPPTQTAPAQQAAAPVATLPAPPGVDPGMWAKLSADQQRAVIAASGAPAGQPGY